MNEKVTCNVVKDLLPVYIDDCCSEDTKTVVESHIATCSDCAEELKTLSEGYTKVKQEKNKPELLKKTAKRIKKKYVIIAVIPVLLLCMVYGAYRFLTEAYIMPVKYSEVKISVEELLNIKKEDWVKKDFGDDFEAFYEFDWNTGSYSIDAPTDGYVVPIWMKSPWSFSEVTFKTENKTRVISAERAICGKEGELADISCAYFEVADEEKDKKPFDKIVFRDDDGDHVIWEADK